MPFDSTHPPPQSIQLAQILGALSHALDLTEGQPPGHCLRSCWIGLQIGRALGLSEPALADLYYAVLLKDLGCSSNAARIAQLYGSDDRAFKRASKTLTDSKRAALRFIFDHTRPGAGLAERVRCTINAVRTAGDTVQDLIETRCDRGAAIARQLRFPPAVADAIRSLDEHWNGQGRPQGLRGRAISLYSRIALLAQVVDVFATAAGPEAARAEVQSRSGTWFDPELVDTFLGAARDPAFWSTLASPDIDTTVLALEPGRRAIIVDEAYLDDIAAAFAQVIDAKSPYTSGHSDRVADFTTQIARHIGLDPATIRRLRRAALLHDVGKLGVSNTILDKPGKLDDAEWQAMRQHAVHSERILSRIPAFADIAEIGGAHHERLDGNGYPRRLEAAQIAFQTRIVSAADVCDALTATRPYRAAMPHDQMLAIMHKDSGTAFDPICIVALTELSAAGALKALSLEERVG